MKIDELRKLVDSATKGPWAYSEALSFERWDISKPDGELIVAMRNHFEALLDVAEAAKQASVLMNNFYLKVSQSGHVQTINEEDNEVWFARDQIDNALKRLEETKCYY